MRGCLRWRECTRKDYTHVSMCSTPESTGHHVAAVSYQLYGDDSEDSTE